jgi:hypothetical protein
MSARIEEIGGMSLDRASKVLAGVPGGAFKAASAALRRAGGTAKTRAGQFAAEEYAIAKGDFMKNVAVSTDIRGQGGAAVSLNIRFAGTVLPLLVFNTRFSRGGLLTTQVKRNGSAAALQHAFAERVFGPVAVFERVGAPRFPVKQLFGPSTAHMMQSDEVVKKMDAAILESFESRMEHEITRILNGWGM